MQDIMLYPLNLKNVNVSYAAKPAISNITFDVRSGEVFGLIGLNGAGKTTIIKTILNLREVDSGEINILNDKIDSSKSKKKLSYLPEKFEPPWFLTGFEFINFSLKLYHKKMSKAQIIQAARDVALDPDALSRRTQTYSKGMRQKLGLLGTMLTECSLMILDEPMSGLDPLARIRVKDMIMKLKKDDCTIFLSSHVLADMDEICDRIAILHKGTIQYIGAPLELKEKVGVDNLEKAFLDYIELKEVA